MYGYMGVSWVGLWVFEVGWEAASVCVCVCVGGRREYVYLSVSEAS